MRKILSLLLLAIFMASCSERINFNVNDAAPQPVITGYICTVPGCYSIRISSTSGYFGSSSTRDIAAVVDINGIPLVKDDSIRGKYNTPDDFCAVEGELYTLTVRMDFDGDGINETYTASEVAPSTVPLQNLILQPLSNDENPHSLPATSLIIFQDPVGPNNYGAHLYITSAQDSSGEYRRYHMSNTLSDYVTNMFSNDVEDGSTIFYPAYFITRRMLYTETDTIDVFPFDTIEVELNNHSYTYYEFIRQGQTAVSGENPLFMSPAGTFITNIEGGAIGAFGIYSCSTMRQPVTYTPDTWSDEKMEKRFGSKWREMFNTGGE